MIYWARSQRVRNESAELAGERRRLSEELAKREAERDRFGGQLAASIRAAFRIQGQIAAKGQLRESQAELRQQLKAIKIEIAHTRERLAALGEAAQAG